MNLNDLRTLVTLDFETTYSKDYSLSKMTTEEYIRDPRFEEIGCGVKINGAPSVWMAPADFRKWAAGWDWDSTAMLGHHCVPGDVEVLTRRGWVRIDAAHPTEEIMQWDPDTSALTWVRPRRKIERTSQEMYLWGTNHHRCAYTPQHRMYYCTPNAPQWRVTTAEQAAQMGPNNVYIPLGGTYRSDAPIDLQPTEARLMEAIRADGSWQKYRGEVRGVRFKLVKPRKIERLRQMLRGLSIPFQENKSLDVPGAVGISAHISDATVARIAALLGIRKRYGMWILNLSEEAREAILDEGRHWDGSQRAAPHSYMWSSAHPETVEAFQLLAHTTGWSFTGSWKDNQRGMSAHIKGARLYVATVCKKARAKLVVRPAYLEFDTPQPVYCFEVPTGAFLVRSGNRVHVTGNCHFDGRILSYHHNIIPAFYLDTLSMARAIHHGTDVGGSLAKLMRHYQVGEKGTEVLRAIGKRLADFTPEEWLLYGDYCNTDVQGTYDIFWKMMENNELPESELPIIDATVRMFTDPAFEVDEPMLEAFIEEEKRRKQALLDRILQDKKTLNSGDKLAQLLFEMGVDPPRKISPRTGKETWAFAKSDEGMKALLEHEREEVRWVAEARVGVKSNINETRATRILNLGRNGQRVPVYLKYAAAHTYRWGGGDKTNFQNLQRGGVIRKALKAPKGTVLVVADSAQIEARGAGWFAEHHALVEAFAQKRDVYSEFASEAYGREVNPKLREDDRIPRLAGKTCLAAGTLVFTQRGPTPIEEVKLSDRVWDGQAWVSHDGVIDQGEKRVIERAGVAATLDHRFLVQDDREFPARTVWDEWGYVATDRDRLVRAFRAASPRDVLRVPNTLETRSYNARVYDIANAGPLHRFTVRTSIGTSLIASNCILGLGYGMGWKKLAITFLQGPMGADPIQFTTADAENLGVDPARFIDGPYGEKCLKQIKKIPSRLPLEDLITHCAVANHFVQTYRRQNAPITDLWKLMEVVLKAMIDNEEGQYSPFGPDGADFYATRHGIVLPNEMVLYYPGLKWTPPAKDAEEDEFGFAPRGHFSYIGNKYKKAERTKAYGGLMTENLVQAFCRAILAEQMQRCRDKYGFHTVTTTHDEIVACVPAADGDKALDAMLHEMRIPPAWCQGLPLNAEGKVVERYGDAK